MITQYQIKKIKTKDKRTGENTGFMIPIWKDYDDIKKIKPRFVYYFTCAPAMTKGPYLHLKRRGLLTLIEGKILFVYQDKDKFVEKKIDATNQAAMIDIPARVGYFVRNPYRKEAKLINICDYPWRDGDNETITPDFAKYHASR